MEKPTYIFDCGCRTENPLYIAKNNHVLTCEFHEGARLLNKQWICEKCGKAFITSKKTQKVFTCTDCRKDRELEVRREYHKRRVKPVQSAMIKPPRDYDTPDYESVVYKINRAFDNRYPVPTINPEEFQTLLRLINRTV